MLGTQWWKWCLALKELFSWQWRNTLTEKPEYTTVEHCDIDKNPLLWKPKRSLSGGVLDLPHCFLKDADVLYPSTHGCNLSSSNVITRDIQRRKSVALLIVKIIYWALIMFQWFMDLIQFPQQQYEVFIIIVLFYRIRNRGSKVWSNLPASHS